MRKLKIVFVWLILTAMIFTTVYATDTDFSEETTEFGDIVETTNKIVSVSSSSVSTSTDFYLILDLSAIDYTVFTVDIVNTENVTISTMPEEAANVSSSSTETSFSVDKNSIDLEKLAIVYTSPENEGTIDFAVTITSGDEIASLQTQLSEVTTELAELATELETLNGTITTEEETTDTDDSETETEDGTETEETSSETETTDIETQIAELESSIEKLTAEKTDLEEQIANYVGETVTESVSVTVSSSNSKKVLGLEDEEDDEMKSIMSSMQKMMSQLEDDLQTANDTISSLTETVTYQGSQNNYLSKLSLYGVDLNTEFKKTTSTYFATVGSDVSKVSVTATAEDSDAIVTVYGNTNLQTGKNKILITVTAVDGSTRTYKIYVTKQ